MILSPAQAGWQIDLNSPLRNSDQIDSGNPVGSARVKKTLLGVVVNWGHKIEVRFFRVANKVP
jgi:hypothetical protein